MSQRPAVQSSGATSVSDGHTPRPLTATEPRKHEAPVASARSCIKSGGGGGRD